MCYWKTTEFEFEIQIEKKRGTRKGEHAKKGTMLSRQKQQKASFLYWIF